MEWGYIALVSDEVNMDGSFLLTFPDEISATLAKTLVAEASELVRESEENTASAIDVIMEYLEPYGFLVARDVPFVKMP